MTNLQLRSVLSWAGCLLLLPTATAWAVDAQQPNIVFMLADDQAWNGLSVPMHPDVAESKGRFFQTPNIEKLAAQGMRFSQAYAPAPVCSPTRISLQTGKSPAQLHWTKAAPPVEGMRLTEPRLIKSIASTEITVGELLKSAGYMTAHFGKWHIAGGGPGKHGYDEHDGDTGNEHAFRFVDPNPVDIFGMAERAERFMAKAQQAGKPFYIQLSWNALHASENATKTALAKYEKLMSGANDKAISTAAITEDLDRGVGKVMEAIDRLRLSDSTYVIYMSDNGAGGGGGGGGRAGDSNDQGGNLANGDRPRDRPGRRGGLRGGKGGVWEGGIRVPLIVRGPSVDANSWCHVPVVGYDLLPTFCRWAGVDSKQLPNSIEGGPLDQLLTQHGQGTVTRKYPGLCFHFPHYQSEGPQSSLLLGNMKLVHFYEDGRIALFDLAKDIGESQDLSQTMPDVAERMRGQLNDYLTAVNAQLPTVNAQYDPKLQSSPEAQRGPRGPNKDKDRNRSKPSETNKTPNDQIPGSGK